MPSTTPSRAKLFISYCHRDKDFLERLQVFLKPQARQGLLDPWDDTRIQPGQDWRKEIEAALEEASVAVLLISADFMASDFIHDAELPVLLAAEESRGLYVIPVIVGVSEFDHTPSLNRFQAANSPSKPLKGMDEAEQDEVWQRVAQTIRSRLSPP